MTKIGKQGFMSTATYSSSFTNANFMTKKQPKDQSRELVFENKSQDQGSSLENHNCAQHAGYTNKK